MKITLELEDDDIWGPKGQAPMIKTIIQNIQNLLYPPVMQYERAEPDSWEKPTEEVDLTHEWPDEEDLAGLTVREAPEAWQEAMEDLHVPTPITGITNPNPVIRMDGGKVYGVPLPTLTGQWHWTQEHGWRTGYGLFPNPSETEHNRKTMEQHKALAETQAQELIAARRAQEVERYENAEPDWLDTEDVQKWWEANYERRVKECEKGEQDLYNNNRYAWSYMNHAGSIECRRQVKTGMEYDIRSGKYEAEKLVAEGERLSEERMYGGS